MAHPIESLHESDVDFWSTTLLGMLYFVLFVYAGTRVMCAAPGQTALYKAYTRLVMGGALLRCTYFVVPWSVLNVPFTPSNVDLWSLGWWCTMASFVGLLCVANLLFYSTFVLLVYYWAQVCDDAGAFSTRVFWCLGSAYTLFHIFVLVFYCLADFLFVLWVYSLASSVFALVIVVLYTWYAARLVRLLKPSRRHRIVMRPHEKRPSRGGSFVELSSGDGTPFLTDPMSPQIRDRVVRVSVVAAVVNVGYIGRCGMLAFQAYLTWLQWHGDMVVGSQGGWWWVFVTAFYFINEICCTTGVLMLMNPRPAAKKALQHVSYTSNGPGSATGVFSDL